MLASQLAWAYAVPCHSGCWSTLDGVRRYAWWSPQQGSIENMTGPNALWYGSGNQTRPTSLGNLYLEQGGPGCYAT